MSKAVTRAKRSGSGAKRATTRGTTGKRRESSKARSAGNRAKSAASAAKRDDVSAECDELLPEGKLYYRIGEVSQITGVKAYVLRYWESEFRWMAPQKSRSKQRLYRRKDIEMILLIQQLLHGQRYTIAGARQRLRELGIGKALEEAVEAVEETAREAAANPAFDYADAAEAFGSIRNELLAIRDML